MRKQFMIVGVLTLVPFLLFAGDKDASMQTEPFPEANCPLAVGDVAVNFQKTDSGAILDFSTVNSENIADLQARVRHMAAMYNENDYGYMKHGPMLHTTGQMIHTGGMMHGSNHYMNDQIMIMGPMMDAQAVVEKTEHGAHLVLTARDKEQVPDLQSHVQWMTQHMVGDSCPHMQKQKENKSEQKNNG